MEGVWKSLLTFCPRRRLKLRDKQLETAGSSLQRRGSAAAPVFLFTIPECYQSPTPSVTSSDRSTRYWRQAHPPAPLPDATAAAP